MSRAALAHVADSAPPARIHAAPAQLRINRPGDRYEREAEQAAEQVTSIASHKAAWSLSRVGIDAPLQRECSCDGQCNDCKKDKILQRDAVSTASPAVAPPAVHSVLRGVGRQMDASTRGFMESRFGYDFSKVRIFNDDAAANSARAVSANAYTVGDKIVFDRGKYAPASHSGRRLLAHELSHVVQQSRGGSPPPATGSPTLEGEAGHISTQVDNPESGLAVRQSSGIGLARDAEPGQQTLIEVKFPDGVKQLTQDEFAGYKRRALNNLRSDLNLVAGLADNGRKTQESTLAEYQGGVESLWDVVKKPKALIGIAADIKAGVTPPYIGAWSNPKHAVDLGVAACDREDLAEAARSLKLADTQFRAAMHDWNAYREATIGGAEGVISNLETVRDVSFAVALVAGAAVAAPVIAAGVAATGATGATATVLTTVGTTLATGTGGAVLGGGSTAAASLASTGKVDVKAVKADAIKFGKQGLVTGLTAGLGSSLAAAGTGAKLAQPFVQTAARKCLTEAGVNVAGEVTTQLLDAAVPGAKEKSDGGKQEGGPKPIVPGPARAALTGCLSGVLGVPVAKLGRTGAKASELAVGAGVGYVDARLSGQSNKEAALAALQNVVTSAAVAHGHAGTEHAKAAKGGPAHEAHGGASKPASVPAEHAPSATVHPEGGAPKSAGGQATHSAEPPKKPPAERFKEKQKALTGHEGLPAVMKEEAKAKRSIGDGHEVVVTEHGVGRCSPSPCPVISVEFAKELKADKKLQRLNEEVQALRKTNPDLAAEKATDLIRSLEKRRRLGSGVRAHDEELLRFREEDLVLGEGDEAGHGQREAERKSSQSRSEEREHARRGIKRTPAVDAKQDVMEMTSRAQQGEYNSRSMKNKEKLLRKFKALLKMTDQRDLPRIKNKMLGDFDEAVRTPGKVSGSPQDKFVAGTHQLEIHDLPTGRASYAQPDYSVQTDTGSGGRRRAHVNLKAHALENLNASQARAVAKGVADQAERNKFHLPEGEPIIISFAETPSKEIQQTMLAELFRTKGPIGQVRFGSTTHRR